jgi:putative oxidoreductase
MKKLFNVEQNSNAADIGLLVARVGIAALMLTHGLPKLNMLLAGGEIQFASVMGLSAATSLALAVFAEVGCSILIGLGLATRLAAIPAIITMAVAAFAIHAADPFAKKELAILYMLVYVVLLIAGSGKYSLDRVIVRSTALNKSQKNNARRLSFN